MSVMFFSPHRSLMRRATRHAPVATNPIDPVDIAIKRITAETGCRRRTARRTLSWIGELVQAARKPGSNHVCYPTDRDMSSRYYFIMDQVMPHGANAVPGSAHEAIERVLLDPTRDEYGIKHEGDDDALYYCAVRLIVSTV